MTKKDRLKKEYRKQRKRILSTIRRYEKKGFFIDLVVPDIPKNITQGSINRLEKIDLHTLRQSAYLVDLETGEKGQNYYSNLITEEYKRKEQREHAKGNFEYVNPFSDSTNNDYDNEDIFESDVVLSHFKASLSSYNENAQAIILSWLNSTISRVGKVETARVIQKASDDGITITHKIVYDEKLLRGQLSRITNYLDATPISRDYLIDSLEQDEFFDNI